SADGETVTRLVHAENATRFARLKQTIRDRVADQLLDGVAHWTRPQLWVESFSHEEGQYRLVQLQLVAVRREKLDFPQEKLLGDFQLVFVTEAVEHEFLVDPGENLRTQRLLRPGQDVALQSRVIGMLQGHQFGRADV